MNDNRPAIEIKNLSYSYKSDWSSKRFPALHAISLSVLEGESFGFLGHNGAGKTTTIKCILGLIRPSGGTIRIFGEDHRRIESRKAVGYVPEQPYFYDYLTVQEIMEMYAALAGLQKGESEGAIARALDLVRVSAKSKSPMRALSKGLTQRVAMAQAIVASPRLLILDEPFSGLDPIGRKEFKDLLFMLKKDGTTLFMSSHILSDVEFLCDRASIMAHGKLKAVFDMKNIPTESTGSYELLVRDERGVREKLSALGGEISTQNTLLKFVISDRTQAENALRACLDAGAKVEAFEFLREGLEELFVKLVKFDEAGEGQS